MSGTPSNEYGHTLPIFPWQVPIASNGAAFTNPSGRWDAGLASLLHVGQQSAGGNGDVGCGEGKRQPATQGLFP
jgi:hypothetical protein